MNCQTGGQLVGLVTAVFNNITPDMPSRLSDSTARRAGLYLESEIHLNIYYKLVQKFLLLSSAKELKRGNGKVFFISVKVPK